MSPIWVVRLQCIGRLDDMDRARPGFINVVASATSALEAEQKVIAVLKGYEWEVLGLEETWEADPDHEFSDPVLNEVIADVAQHPHHVRLSTFHTYPPD